MMNEIVDTVDNTVGGLLFVVVVGEPKPPVGLPDVPHLFILSWFHQHVVRRPGRAYLVHSLVTDAVRFGNLLRRYSDETVSCNERGVKRGMGMGINAGEIHWD